jgi:hypothetical protein
MILEQPSVAAGAAGVAGVAGESVAVHYSFLYRNRLYYYQTGRRMSTPSHLSVGPVLLVRTLQELAPRECTAVEFLAGSCQYKRTFTHEERPWSNCGWPASARVRECGGCCAGVGGSPGVRWAAASGRVRVLTKVNTPPLRKSRLVNAPLTRASGHTLVPYPLPSQLARKTRGCGESTKNHDRE